MRLHILGSSGTYPTPGRPASGYLLEHRSTRVWCDAGPGTFPALWDLVDLGDLSGVVISHALAYGNVGRGRLSVWGPVSVFERLAGFLSPDDPGRLASVFEINPVDTGDSITIGDIDIGFAATDHSVPTLASRWQADGRVFAFSADTGPKGPWASVADDADLFLCEASYQGESGSHEYPYHLTAGEAGRIAREQDASRLIITHIPPHLDGTVSVDEAERAFDRPVMLAVPGGTHDV